MMVNPMKEVTYEELVKTSGIPLHIPEEATEVVYSTIALEPPVAQATFTLDGKDVCLRAVATNELEALKKGATKEALVELANAVFVEVQGDVE